MRRPSGAESSLCEAPATLTATSAGPQQRPERPLRDPNDVKRAPCEPQRRSKRPLRRPSDAQNGPCEPPATPTAASAKHQRRPHGSLRGLRNVQSGICEAPPTPKVSPARSQPRAERRLRDPNNAQSAPCECLPRPSGSTHESPMHLRGDSSRQMSRQWRANRTIVCGSLRTACNPLDARETRCSAPKRFPPSTIYVLRPSKKAESQWREVSARSYIVVTNASLHRRTTF